MDRKKSDVLFVVLILMAFLLTSIGSKFYDHYLEGQREPMSFTVKDFLSVAQSSPEEHLIVLGESSTDFEQSAAEKLSNAWGIRIKEAPVDSIAGLILIGSPKTNLALDRYLKEPYNPHAATLSVEGQNLVVVVSDSAQAGRVTNLLLNFKDEPVLLSPGTVRLEFEKTAMLAIILLVLCVPAFLVYFDGHKQFLLTLPKESKEEAKLQAIAGYVRKYEEQGYSEQQIRAWLEKYGYDEELVDIALRRG